MSKPTNVTAFKLWFSRLADMYRCIRGTSSDGWGITFLWNAVNICQNRRCHFPEDINLRIRYRVNFKSYQIFLTLILHHQISGQLINANVFDIYIYIYIRRISASHTKWWKRQTDRNVCIQAGVQILYLHQIKLIIKLTNYERCDMVGHVSRVETIS
jgi:hypothetical protein